MTHRFASVTATALAVALALALGACQSSGPPSTQATDQPTTAGETMTYTSVDEALSDHRSGADNSLSEVLGYFEVPDPDQVERFRNESRPACTFDPNPPLSLSLGTRFQVADPGSAVDHAIEQAEGQGWTRTATPGSGGQSHLLHRDDFILTVAWGQDDWVILAVESPCYASDGTRVS